MEVGIPLYLVERMTMIFLSTHKGVDTIFYRLMQLEDEHGKKVFTSLNMTLKCDACIAEGVQGDHCPHRSHLVPPWKPQGRARIINRAMMKHFPQTFDEEISNIAQEGGKPAFSRADVDFLEMEQPYTDTRNDMPLLIVTCIDPTGGGRSRYAGASVYYRAPGEYVLAGVFDERIANEDMWQKESDVTRDYFEALIQRTNYSNTIHLVGIEANIGMVHTSGIASVIQQTFLDAGVNPAQLRFFTEVPSHVDTTGIWTTAETKESMKQQLYTLLRRRKFSIDERCIVVSSEHASVSLMREALCTQLRAYKYVVRSTAAVRKGTQSAHVSLTGKGSGPDDLGIAVQLAIYFHFIAKMWGKCRKYELPISIRE